MTRTTAVAAAFVVVLMASAANAERTEEIQAPRSQEIVTPRHHEEIQAPRGQEIQAPRGQEEIQAPRGAQVETLRR